MRNRLFFLLLVFAMLTVSIMPSMGFAGDTGTSGFDHYNGYLEIRHRLENITAMHSDISRLLVLGQTFEGRDIMAVRLTDNPDIEETRETDVLIMGGHHAKELPSVEVPLYILEFLAGNYSTNSSVRRIVDSRDIWFVPLLNPDGREYAMNVDVNWRKNRRPIDLDADGIPEGIGVDLNRNYGHLWGQQGTSPDPASNIYCGPSAFSENETRAIRALATAQNFSISLSYHTYGQIIYYPWNNGIDTLSPREATLRTIASELGQRTGYTPMEGKNAYFTTGDSDDWLYADTYSLPFTIELGTQFTVPNSEILALCRKNLGAAIYALEIADKPEQAALPDWTVMVYMAADAEQSLSDQSAVDINEMEVAGSGQDLNILAFQDGMGTGDSRIYRVEKDTGGLNSVIVSPVVDDLGAVIPASGEADMSDFRTLRDYVQWVTDNYPAKHYLLDVWGHGNGIMEGFAYDRGSLMQVSQIRDALGGFELDIVGFDTCSMGHLEVAAELTGISDILIGSEAEEPLSGWDYAATFQKLASDTNMEPGILAANIVNDYLNSVTAAYVTQAAIDLNVFRERLLPLLDDFVNVSLDFAYPDYENIWTARNYTDTFVTGADAVDLFEYLDNLAGITVSEPVTDRIRNLLAARDDTVIASGSGTGHPDSRAMAVYFPKLGNAVPAKYSELDFAGHLWDEYLGAINNPEQKPVIGAGMPDSIFNNTGPFGVSATSTADSLYLVYRANGRTWQTGPMNLSGGKFTGIIPGQANGSVVEYYLFQPDSNITEPYEVKWGSGIYFNYTVSAVCDLRISGFTVSPRKLESGNHTIISVNCTNLGPDFTLVNISIEAESLNDSRVLDWRLVTMQPGEYFILNYDWAPEAGQWNVTVRAVSMGFRDRNLSDNLAALPLDVAASVLPRVSNSGFDDMAIIMLVLVLAASIPLVAFTAASRRVRRRKLMIAEKKIISARSFTETAREFGGDVTRSNIMLASAEAALKRGNSGESEAWCRRARDEAMLSVAEQGDRQ